MHTVGLSESLSPLPYIQFVDYQTVDWRNVKRTRYFFYQHFHYQYPGPIHDLYQRLIVIPVDHYGAQHLREHQLRVNPTPSAKRIAVDGFGNRVFEFKVKRADQEVTFEVLMTIESKIRADHIVPMSASAIASFRRPTPLTTPNARLTAIGEELAAQSRTPYELAQRISDWVHHAMRYGSGATTVATTAAQALAIGQGLCQDYAHLMIALCRSVNLPTRYISGHLLGEGGSHAWVEVLLPTSTPGDSKPKKGNADYYVHAFDPTNRHRPNLSYITVAVGRDYSDVSPVTGSFTAPYSGHLICRKRAGLTFVEYMDGSTLGNESRQNWESDTHSDSAAR